MLSYRTIGGALGKLSWKNPILKELPASKDADTDLVWNQILLDGGSVRNVAVLSDEEKAVYARSSARRAEPCSASLRVHQ
ncbi:hypothetical protein LZ686_16565 [Paracoccus sp. NFXS7]|uniref:hypothetical protein n=1 Tax=Paracoccus sp. NFXS7 TaxID=2908653 RepID=UPI0032DFFDA0